MVVSTSVVGLTCDAKAQCFLTIPPRVHVRVFPFCRNRSLTLVILLREKLLRGMFHFRPDFSISLAFNVCRPSGPYRVIPRGISTFLKIHNFPFSSFPRMERRSRCALHRVIHQSRQLVTFEWSCCISFCPSYHFYHCQMAETRLLTLHELK